MKTLSSLVSLVIILLCSSWLCAHDRPVIIPDPVAAVKSITDASASNPYLIFVGPGVYQISSALAMKEYVSISGSGRSVTTIKGSFNSDYHASASVIKGADNSTLSDLTVKNTSTGGNLYIVGIYSVGDSTFKNVRVIVNSQRYNLGMYLGYGTTSITDCLIEVYGSKSNQGIHFFADYSTKISNLQINIEGGGSGIGIYMWYDTLSWAVLEDTDISIKGSNSCKGILTEFAYVAISRVNISLSCTNKVAGAHFGYSTITMNDTVIDVNGSNDVNGVITDASSPVMTNVTIKATGGVSNYGINIWDFPAKLHIRNSVIKSEIIGTGSSFGSSNYYVYFAGSSLLGQVDPVGTYTCLNSNNGVDKELDANCNEITPASL